MVKSGRFFLLIVVCVLLVLMVIHPQRYIDSAMEGIEIFTFSVLPALFPFFVLTRLFTALGGDRFLSKYSKGIVKKLYGAPSIAGSISLLSMLSGYPIGAKMVSDNYKNGIIDLESTKRIITFTSTSGPLFILGTIGIKFLNDYKAGATILAVHLLSAVLNGVIFKMVDNHQSADDALTITTSDDFYREAIDSSITAILQVCGSIVILNMVISALTDFNIISFISKSISAFGVNMPVADGVAVGLVEITKGVKVISEAGIKIKDTIVPISVIVSFGGCSVAMQSMVFLRSCGIKTSYYFVTKLSQAVISYILSSIVVALMY